MKYFLPFLLSASGTSVMPAFKKGMCFAFRDDLTVHVFPTVVGG